MQIQAYLAAAVINLKRLAAAFAMPFLAMLFSSLAQLGNLNPAKWSSIKPASSRPPGYA